MAEVWGSWLEGQLQGLEQQHLQRSLRPIIATNNPVHVVVPRETMESWVRGDYSAGECSVPGGAHAPEVCLQLFEDIKHY